MAQLLGCVGLAGERAEQLHRVARLPTHRQGQRQVHLCGAHVGIHPEGAAIGGLRIGVAPLKVAGDAKVVQRHAIPWILAQRAQEGRFGPDRIGCQPDAAEANLRADRGRILRGHLAEGYGCLLGSSQRGERLSLGCQGGPVAGILRQDTVGDLQGDLWRATLQRGIGHVEPRRS